MKVRITTVDVFWQLFSGAALHHILRRSWWTGLITPNTSSTYTNMADDAIVTGEVMLKYCSTNKGRTR